MAARPDDGVLTVGRSRIGTIFANTGGVLFALVMIFPVYWVLNTALKPRDEVMSFEPYFIPAHPTLENFSSAIKADNFIQGLVSGLVITLMSVAAALVI